MQSVYVMWQDVANTRMWHPVAKLVQESRDCYLFKYTKGANHKAFSCFPNMGEKEKEYRSDTLFTFFKNRLIPESRPEHDSLFQWAGLSIESKDYVKLLAISGGEKKTDHFRIINTPKKIDNFYKLSFFVSGIRYLNVDERESLNALEQGDRLDFEFDRGNPKDAYATLLYKKGGIKVGYLPHYLCKDLINLLSLSPKSEIQINVLRVNDKAPHQYRILCELKAPWVDGFKPFDDDEFMDF